MSDHASAQPSSMTDAERAVELLARAGTGDATAFSAFYDDTAPRVYGVVLHIVGDRSSASRVAREVYLRAWRGSAHYDPGQGSARQWLMVIAHHCSVEWTRDAARRRVRRARLTGLRTNYRPEGDAGTRAAQLALMGRPVRQTLDGMPSLEREALELAYFGGWTHAEIADITGLVGGRAVDEISRGLVRLRDR